MGTTSFYKMAVEKRCLQGCRQGQLLGSRFRPCVAGQGGDGRGRGRFRSRTRPAPPQALAFIDKAEAAAQSLPRTALAWPCGLRYNGYTYKLGESTLRSGPERYLTRGRTVIDR